MKRNIVINQGDDVRIVFDDVEEIQAGDSARSQMRQWPNGPLMANFLCTVSTSTKRIVLALPRSVADELTSSGVYDVELHGPDGIRTVRNGPALVRPQTTSSAGADYLDYDGFDELSYGTFADIHYGEF